MKANAAVLLSMTLAGCTGPDEVVRAKPRDACSFVAEQRMQDGALNGYDRKAQKLTYDHTYNDCVKWNLAHGVKY